MARVKNNFFQFKEFRIVQHFSAMKVSTDACVFGAYVAHELQEMSATHVLDIGAGTGLLSLMVAQKNVHLKVDAVEIDQYACQDAAMNFLASPYSNRLQLFSSSIQNFHTESAYDVIISNPPFFLQSLKNPNWEKSMARHADVSLTMDDLFQQAHRLNHSDGIFITLYPYGSQQQQINIAEKYGYYLSKSINIKSFQDSIPHCVINTWRFEPSEYDVQELIIYTNKSVYSNDFVRLLIDYYLYL